MFLTNSFSRLPPRYPTPPKTEIFLVLIFDNTTVEWDSIYLEDIKYGSKLKNYIIHKYNLDYNYTFYVNEQLLGTHVILSYLCRGNGLQVKIYSNNNDPFSKKIK